MLIWGGLHQLQKPSQNIHKLQKNGNFEDANDQGYHNSDTWKWASGEEIAFGETITNSCSFC